jgi:glycosyltransferase involved in cell wall biosynthesis
VTAPTACTIIARNYLAYARVLARSYSEWHPGERLKVLVVDDLEGLAGRDEPFDPISPVELPMTARTLHDMATCYDAMELSTALKPWLLRLLLTRGGGRPILYLDPDILVMAPLDEVYELATAGTVVLTPHTTRPIPRDGLKPSEVDILASGVHNLGFIALSEGAEPFLDWWSERLRLDALVDHAGMMFTDQRWVDLAVPYFDFHLLGDPGYNVAYWNADQRLVERQGDGYSAGGQPLRFFHFSGFDPCRPHILSKHQGDRPRVLLSEHPAIAELCREYAVRLQTEEYSDHLTLPYGWGTFPEGTPVDRRIRRAYRAGLVRAERFGDPSPPDGFDPVSTQLLFDWLSQPDPWRAEAPRMPRYLWEIYADRPDVQRAYPLPNTRDETGFREWLRLFAINEETVPDPLKQLVLGEATWGAPAVHPAPPDGLRPGLLLAGYLRADLGLGQAARLAMAAIRSARIPCASRVYAATASRQGHPWDQQDTCRPDLDTNLVWVNPDQLPDFAATAGPEYFDGRYTVGNWAWETDRLPGWMGAASNLLDEIWTPSDYSRAAIERTVSERPVYTFPHPILVPQMDPLFDRRSAGLPDGYVFLFVYDFLSTVERKNPLGLIEAFKTAFRPGEGPTLVLKSINGSLRVLEMERLRLTAEERPDIVFADRYLTRPELASLVNCSDCYVSLHRAEGFGLTIADAMALAKPCIATGYSGNLEFMSDSTSYLVPHTLAPVRSDTEVYGGEGWWAEPDVGAAAELLRRVYSRPQEARKTGEAGRGAVLRHHSLDHATRFVRRRFKAIQKMRRADYSSEVAGAVRSLIS